MASYKLLIKPSAVKELEAIEPKKNRQRIAKRITGLAENPRPVGSEKLSAGDWYRVRQGQYRILYEVLDLAREVVVVKIGHRRDVYR